MNTNKYILYGPPASGKSTLVKFAIENGLCGLDLEEVHGSKENRLLALEEFLKVNSEKVCIVGAQALQPSDFPKGSIHVLLLPSKETYVERLEKRDIENPEKAGQEGLRWYEGFSLHQENYNRVINTDQSLKEVLKEILK